MDAAEFKAVADRLVLAADILADIPLGDIIKTVERADAILPIVDPTEYRNMLYRDSNMHDLRRLAELAQPLADAIRELREKTGTG